MTERTQPPKGPPHPAPPDGPESGRQQTDSAITRVDPESPSQPSPDDTDEPMPGEPDEVPADMPQRDPDPDRPQF